MRRALALLALAGAVAVGAAQAQSAGQAGRSIAIVSAKASGNVVVLTVKITGWKMYPKLVGKKVNKADGGHWHIFVDGQYNNFSASATSGRTAKLKAGTHKIRVELANDDHSLLKPPVSSKTATVVIASGGSPPPQDSGDYGY